MKIAVPIIVLAIVSAVILRVLMIRSTHRLRNEAYDKYKASPPIAVDFTTPEGAILCLEDAYRRHDIEAAIAAKDFNEEAKRMLQKIWQNTGNKDTGDEKMVALTVEALLATFRLELSETWPNFEGLESFFTKREPDIDSSVIVTEMCRFPDGGFSQQRLLVAETPQGWRVLNLVD